MPLLILRIVFVAVAAGLGVWLVNGGNEPFRFDLQEHPYAVLTGVLLIAGFVIAADVFVRRKRLDTVSAVYFGLIVGLLLTYVAFLALTPLPLQDDVRNALSLVIGMVLCYACISLLLQTRNDFRFIIPYVEFSKEVKGFKPFILDTSVIIDGRIADIVDTKIFDSQLIMPRFVLAELQAVADSSDRLKRGRGRRGLDILNRLSANKDVDFQMYDRELPEFVGQPVDMKLVLLAKHLEGKVITNDYNLNKVAQLHGVGVINLNDLANALKPIFLPGESMEVRIVKPGEEAGQGVGYLDDGTMVVVEAGRDQIGRTVKIAVTSVLQTSAGRMIFGRFDGPLAAGREQPAAHRH
ncbi:MAG: TRAM domain-containing protein [Pirellulales bacterium]|nr:TRAM domain-containing protein [Pirellulales bacterium]